MNSPELDKDQKEVPAKSYHHEWDKTDIITIEIFHFSRYENNLTENI